MGKCRDFGSIALERPQTYSANYTFSNYPESNDWYNTPFRTKNEASEFLETLQTLKFEIVKIPTKWRVEPNLEAARSCAIWERCNFRTITK